jgi:hypothetical protein
MAEEVKGENPHPCPAKLYYFDSFERSLLHGIILLV